jgi:hypothetical protein
VDLAAVRGDDVARRVEDHADLDVRRHGGRLEAGPAAPAATHDADGISTFLLGVRQESVHLGIDAVPFDGLHPAHELLHARAEVKVRRQAVAVGAALERRLQDLGHVRAVAFFSERVGERARAAAVPAPHVREEDDRGLGLRAGLVELDAVDGLLGALGGRLCSQVWQS